MDTQKIGRFIAENRKKQNMTQAQLAERLNVTGKTVSRWENGNYMPDLSLLQPLAEELHITLNELLQGEYIPQEKLSEKSEDTLKTTVDYSAKKIKKERNVLHTVYIVAVVLIYFALWRKYRYDDLYLTFKTADECRNFIYTDLKGDTEKQARIHYRNRKYNGEWYQVCFLVSDDELTMFVIEEYKNRYRPVNHGIYSYRLSDIDNGMAPAYLYIINDEQGGNENDLYIMWDCTFENIDKIKVKDRTFRPITDESGLKIWFTSTNTYWDLNNIEYVYQ